MRTTVILNLKGGVAKTATAVNMAAILARGHVLLEDIPGVGKTTMAIAFSKALGLKYNRVQFTPDVMPSDLTGFSLYNKASGQMEYQPGALLCNLFLADELNRATSRTQSALLEAMEERQVTVDGETRALSPHFFVIATQNPVESAGTFPLPEAQMDRFMMRLSIGYPDREQEIRMASQFLQGRTLATVKALCQAEDILSLRQEVRSPAASGTPAAGFGDRLCQSRTELSDNARFRYPAPECTHIAAA